MTDYNISAAHVIRAFLWDRLQAILSWSALDYDGAIPIIASNEEPEFNDNGKPYIVYNYSSQYTPADEYFIEEEIVAFTVYGSTASEIIPVLNLIKDHFKAMDDSARMLNDWVENRYPTQSSPFNNFIFNWTRMTSVIGPSAVTEEAGRRAGVAVVRANYMYNDRADTTNPRYPGQRVNFDQFAGLVP